MIIVENQTFGDFLKKERKKRNMTQKEFCKIIDVSSNTLINYENGHFEPSKKRQEEIKKILNGEATPKPLEDRLIELREHLDNKNLSPEELLKEPVDVFNETMTRMRLVLDEFYSCISEDKYELLILYAGLNSTGKIKAREYLQDLIVNPKYTKITSDSINEQ